MTDQFQHWIKSMSVEELLSVSAGLKRQAQELNEESQVVSEHLMELRITRMKQRFANQFPEAHGERPMA